MRTKRFTEEQIIGVLKEAEAGAKTKDVFRKALTVGHPPPILEALAQRIRTNGLAKAARCPEA